MWRGACCVMLTGRRCGALTGALRFTFIAMVFDSGFTTTCRANRKSTESTLPALARHWSIFSASK